jgi:anti-sigma factor RsiW
MRYDAPHPSDETLLRAVDGELPDRQREELEPHLAVCAGCRSRMASMQASAEDLSAAWRESGPELPVDRMRARLRAGLDHDRRSWIDRGVFESRGTWREWQRRPLRRAWRLRS